MGKVMQVASFSLAEVTYITGDIGYQVQESVKNAQFRVRAKQENVSGVMLPVFESYQEGTNGESKKNHLPWKEQTTYLRDQEEQIQMSFLTLCRPY